MVSISLCNYPPCSLLDNHVSVCVCVWVWVCVCIQAVYHTERRWLRNRGVCCRLNPGWIMDSDYLQHNYWIPTKRQSMAAPERSGFSRACLHISTRTAADGNENLGWSYYLNVVNKPDYGTRKCNFTDVCSCTLAFSICTWNVWLSRC